MSIKRAFLIGLLLALVGQLAFAQDESKEAEETEKSEERVCINIRTIRTFDALTDEYVYVKEGSSKHFLLTMRGRCHSLRNAQGIAIKDATSRVCSDGFGEIVYRDRMGSVRRIETCLIDTIERVESKEDAREIVEAREAADDE